MKDISALLLGSVLAFTTTLTAQQPSVFVSEKAPLKAVNPYMGNISHLLVPTYPTIQLPNSMLRVYPERGDFTSDRIKGLPLMITSHRGSSAFNLSPVQGKAEVLPVRYFTYDHESIRPYAYRVILDEKQTGVEYALSHQSGIYNIRFTEKEPAYLTLNSGNGRMKVDDNRISGFQELENNTRVYLYMEVDRKPLQTGVVRSGSVDTAEKIASGRNACVYLGYGDEPQTLQLRYGISFISEEQAKTNLYREQSGFNIEAVARKGCAAWEEALSSLEVQGDETLTPIFYTSLYRCFERPICISEDGRYFSAFDGRVHDDEGQPFYTDDWIWDTYRATHPLRILVDDRKETDIIRSFLRMARQMGNDWMPTFPEVTGDSRRMNSNHAVGTIIDAYRKGVRDFDLEYAYEAARKGIEEKTLAPWSAKPSGELDRFYHEKGYIPALHPGEKEYIPEVHRFEKRQPVAVTLGTSYDQWCLSELAGALGNKKDQSRFLKCSYNYRNLFNPETHFFHPKDKEGAFIEPFDYMHAGGMGAREYYGENNAWVYRWDVPHNVADLITLMGGPEQFEANLDQMYQTGLTRSKFEFYAQLPDHTGNVGQFSMANEPSLHIPYLHNYSGNAWKTQKRIRSLINQWFRNDLMGVPGDEDGGGMSAFVVFSMMGFYPMTPGMPVYTIGSPHFPYAKIRLANGKEFEIIAENCSASNKYIRSATLNGKPLNEPWIHHDEIASGGTLRLVMSDVPDKNWGRTADPSRYSAAPID